MTKDELTIALAQVHATVGNVERNIELACERVAACAEQGADLIALPEFFSTGYFPLYWDYGLLDLAEPETGPIVSGFRKLASTLGIHLILPFYELDGPGNYYDTALILAPNGETLGKYRKTHPPARVSLEKLYYRGASRLPVFELFGWQVGILICYDNYLTEPARALMARGAELLIAPFAEVADFDMWAPLLRTRAFENGVYVAACNLVGPDSESEAKEVLGGRSILIDPEGVVLAEAARDREDTISAVATRERLVAVRGKRQFRRDRRPELYMVLSEWDEDARSLSS